MKLIYLSTALENSDFLYLESKTSRKPNPAGQNFHDKMIQAIGEIHPLKAYSLIPNQEGLISESSMEISKNLFWHYIEPMEGKIGRYLRQGDEMAKKILLDVPDLGEKDIVLYDSLNLSLAKAARHLKLKKSCKTVAILTDNPENITGAAKFYPKQCLSLSSSCDGYFALTEGLYSLFAKQEMPHLIRMGLMEPIPKMERPIEAPYLYYGGSLFIKDGTKALLDAYQSIQPNIDLVLAGHGNYEEECRKAAEANPRIHFLGQIGKQDHYAYLQHASLLLNPRIYRERLDKVSVPSKVLEYLASDAPILSSYSAPIFLAYGDSINLLENHGEDPTTALKSFFAQHISGQGEIVDIKKNRCSERLLANNGTAKIASDLISFCASLASQ